MPVDPSKPLIVLLALTLMLVCGQTAAAAEPDNSTTAASQHPGYRALLDNAYEDPNFDWEVFDQLWRTWEDPLRSQAKKAAVEERRRMAFSRYGLTPRPGEESSMPLQYVQTVGGGWSINCFACHGGKVAGRVIPGAPNTHFAMQTLAEDVRKVKLLQGKISRRDLVKALFPTGGSNGTTNAVMFGVALAALRDKDLEVIRNPTIPNFVHHDMDAPPWWNVNKKDKLYIDAFAPNDHRALMQFTMSPENSGADIRGWEDEFRQVYQWILALQPPKYPFAIDKQLAQRGRVVFEQNCAHCHGTYGPQGEYPNKVVPIDTIGTDRVRLEALTLAHRQAYAGNWFSDYGKKQVVTAPQGYIAPPLDGLWASAPYLHNGSVPTLWHLLHSQERPTIWKRSQDGYDQQRVGLEVEVFQEPPMAAKTGAQKRTYFDTTAFSKSAQGHDFPDTLSEKEKQAVLEYLKTL